MEKQTVVLNREKETKNTIRFQEVEREGQGGAKSADTKKK